MFQRNLAINIGFNGQAAQTGLRETDTRIQRVKRSTAEMGRAFERAGQRMGQTGRYMMTRVTLPLVGIGIGAVKAASDFEELESKFNVVFGSLANETQEWADETATAIGRSRASIMGYLAETQNMLVGMGATRSEGQKLSKEMVSLAADLASFNNVAEDQALDSLQSALMGNHMAARSLGAVINENTLALAMERMQLGGKFQDLTELEKMQVRYTAVMMQSEDAMGDAERTSGSFANQVRALRGDLHDMAIEIGQILMPHAQELIGWAREGIDAFRSLDEETQQNAVRFGIMAAAIAPVLLFGSALITSVGKIIGVFVGMGTAITKTVGFVKALTIAKVLLFGKVALLIGAIAGIGYAIYQIYNHWDAITDKIDTAREAIANFINRAKDLVNIPGLDWFMSGERPGGSLGHGGISSNIREMQQLNTGGQIRRGAEGAAVLHENEVVVNSPLVKAMERFFASPDSDRKRTQGGGSVVNYQPTVNINSTTTGDGSASIRRQVSQALEDHYRQNFSRLATNTLR